MTGNYIIFLKMSEVKKYFFFNKFLSKEGFFFNLYKKLFMLIIVK